MIRTFNSDAYNATDSLAKQKTIDVISKTSTFVLLDGLTTELYKECDLKFIEPSSKEVLLIENETREVYDKIIDRYNTIHIPYRKKDSKAHFFFIWKSDFSEFLSLSKDKFEKYKDNVVSLYCRGSYEDNFIDIPKSEFRRFQIINNRIVNIAL